MLRAPHPVVYAPPMSLTTRAGTLVPVAFDGHVHTWHSRDAFEDPLAVVSLARALGLDAVLFTDHGNTRAAADGADNSEGILTVPGEEVGGPFGHALLWNAALAEKLHPETTSLATRARYVHESGGVIVLAHPGWWIAGNAHDPAEWMAPAAFRPNGRSRGLDAIEIWNGVYPRHTRKLVAAWTRLLDLGFFVPIVGDSDFHNHRVHDLGHPHNVALCASKNVADVLDAVRRGQLYVTDGPALAIQANDVTLGGVVHGRPGDPVRVELEALAPVAGELVLFQGSSVVERVALDADKPTTWTRTLPMPEQDSYLRVEINGRGAAGHGTSLQLLSNPILLDPDPTRAAWR